MLKITVIGLATARDTCAWRRRAHPRSRQLRPLRRRADSADCRTYNMPGQPPAKGTSAQPSVHKPVIHAHGHPGATSRARKRASA